MYLRDHTVNLKDMTLNCCANWDDEQDVNTCSILHLNNFGFRTNLRSPMQGFISEIILF